VLVDPCITGPGSHPLHYAGEVLAAAGRLGCECVLAAWHGFDPVGCPPTWRVSTPFRNTSYSKDNAFGELDRCDAHGRLPLVRRLSPAHVVRNRRQAERIAAFAADVRPVIDDLRPGDVLLLATASELEAIGLARAIADLRPPAGIGWHVLFHFPIYQGFAADFPPQDARLRSVRRRLDEAVADAAPHVIHWHTTTPELAAHHARILPGPVSVLPYPVPRLPDRPPRRAGPLRVASLGDVRPEKQSAELPAVVASCAAEMPGRFTFAIQTNLGFPAGSRHADHRTIRAAVEELRRLSTAGAPLELLAGPLDAARYAAELVSADAVLLPYDQIRYRSRCSGIMLETLASAAVPIVTGGGWMARQIADSIRSHVAAVLRDRPTVHDCRHPLPPLRLDRPFVLPLADSCAELPAGSHAILIVEVRWAHRGAASLHEPPVRIAVEGCGPRPATVLAPDEQGRDAVAIVVLSPAEIASGAPRLACGPACGAETAGPAELRIRCLPADGPTPTSAAGIVIASARDVVPALREFADHASHYLQSAAAECARVRDACSGAAVAERLLT
jgi:hypothetical protein